MGLFSFYFTTRNAGRPPRGAAEVHRQDEFHHRDLACRHRNRHNGFVVCRCLFIIHDAGTSS